MLSPRPIKQLAAFAYVSAHHRHHGETLPAGALRCLSVESDGRLCGVAIIGRPCCALQDGWTCEVTRLCTDGTKNACSMLYAMAWRTMGPAGEGYRRIVSYIMEGEDGATLRAAGWRYLWTGKGGHRDRPSRRRRRIGPECPKHAYGIGAWAEALARRDAREVA